MRYEDIGARIKERRRALDMSAADLIAFFDVRKELRCKGKPLSEPDTRAIEAGLTVIWEMVSRKYE